MARRTSLLINFELHVGSPILQRCAEKMNNIVEHFKTKNATFFTNGADRITVELISSIECVKSVEAFDSTPDKPGGFRVVLADHTLSIFKNDEPAAFAETKSGFVGWIDMVGKQGSKADVKGVLAEVERVDGMYGVVCDHEFTMCDDAFRAIEEIARKSDSILFVYNSVMNRRGEFVIGQLWEVGQKILRKPWWKFWS